MDKDDIERRYICPVCAKKSWKRKIEVDLVGDTWRWKCRSGRCIAGQDWQTNVEPELAKKAVPKIGYE